MTTSKCFKFLPNFAFLIVAVLAGTTASAHVEQKLALRKDETVKIACPQGLSPILQGDVLECGRICKLEIVNVSSVAGCDQGGCWSQPTSFRVILTGSKGEPVLFDSTYDSSMKSELIRKIKSDFAESCKLFQESERSE